MPREIHINDLRICISFLTNIHIRLNYKLSWSNLIWRKKREERIIINACISYLQRDAGCRRVKYRKRNKSHISRSEASLSSRLSEPSGQNCTIRWVRPPWANHRPYLPFYQLALPPALSDPATRCHVLKWNTRVCI